MPELRNKKGYTLVELMFVMVLLLLFGILTFELVVSGSNAYKNVIRGRNTASELRVALSYMDMRLRQNDEAGLIRVDKNPLNQGDALVITEEYEGDIYETWIYCDEGKLREAIVKKGETPDNSISTEVADIDRLAVDYRNGAVHTEVARNETDGWKSYASDIHVRSTLQPAEQSSQQ